MEIHISTQANTVSYHTCKFWHRNGAKRIILGHLSGEANTPDLAYTTVAEVLKNNGIDAKKDVYLSVAKRGELGEVIEL